MSSQTASTSKSYVAPILTCVAVGAATLAVDLAVASSIKAERAALGKFRAALQERNDGQARIQRVYCFCYAAVLMIPVIGVVVYVVKSFFTYFTDRVVHAVPHRLWQEKKIDELIGWLEQRMKQKNLSWSPLFLHKQAPSFPLKVLPLVARDLTSEAQRGELSPTTVDAKLLNQLATPFNSTQKKTPLLIGDSAHLTSIAEAVAQKIVSGHSDIPLIFQKKRVFLFKWNSLDLATIDSKKDALAIIDIGNKAEEILKSLFKEVSEQKQRVILMIEFDRFSTDYINEPHYELLRSYLNLNGLITIGLTTQVGYDKLPKHQPLLRDQMEPLKISAPSEQKMMFGAKISLLKQHHSINIEEEAVQAAFHWGASFCKGGSGFDEAYRFLDMAAGRLRLKQAATQDDLQRSSFLKTVRMIRAQIDDATKINQKISEVETQFSQSVTKALVAEIVAETTKTPLEQLQDTAAELLWSEKKFDQLVIALETQITSKIVWSPTFFHKKAPVLPSPCPHLSAFTRDLTLEAERCKLRPFFGRSKGINDIADILNCKQKCNPILIGPSGVGKTALLEGIAQKIVSGDPSLPPIFHNKRIFLIEWSFLSRDTDDYSIERTVKKRLGDILREAAEHKEHVILAIDEIHSFLNQKRGNECMQIVKPALADGSIASIGATTEWDYQQILANDPALERRFPTVPISEPIEQELKQILKAVIPSLEAHHAVQITDQAVDEAIKLSERYFKSLSFPDKAIDLLDHAASQLTSRQNVSPQDNQYATFLKRLLQIQSQMDNPTVLDKKIAETEGKLSKKLSEEMIRQLVAQKVKLPLDRIQQSEKELLSTLEDQLSKKIIGQPKAITALCQGVRRARLKLGDRNRPAGVFLLCGPTGVGKTESVKALAHLLYGPHDNYLRIDMGEYQHSSDINKLIGSSIGYSGHTEGGLLTNWLKKNPRTTVLFDEIEKANPTIFNLLLGLFNDGRITDGNNQTVVCLDATFIMTSNIASQEIIDNQNASEEQLYTLVDKTLKTKFRNEFIGRIQETVIFYPLSDDAVRQIVTLQCTELKKSVESNSSCPRLKMTWDETIVQYLAKTYYTPDKGARALANGIQRTMENRIADLIINDKIKEGDTIHFSLKDNQIQINVSS